MDPTGPAGCTRIPRADCTARRRCRTSARLPRALHPNDSRRFTSEVEYCCSARRVRQSGNGRGAFRRGSAGRRTGITRFSCPRPRLHSPRKGVGGCCCACLRARVKDENRHRRDLVPVCRAAEYHAGVEFPAQHVTRVQVCLDAESPRMNGAKTSSIVCSSGPARMSSSRCLTGDLCGLTRATSRQPCRLMVIIRALIFLPLLYQEW
jgi:hypothetical protein